jgi:presqualene diphosphate synthase
MLGVSEKSPSVATRASGSSFYFAMRILPQAQREAMFEIYAFCRAVDDIADGGGSQAQRVEGLADWRRKIDALYSGRVPEGLDGLATAINKFCLRIDDFRAVIDGMEMDAVEDIRAPDFETLDLYCDRVASAVGRLSVRVFGTGEDDGIQLAHHLGRALQLTNILRDIDEDAEIRRLYLPREALNAAGIDSNDPDAVVADPRIGAACDVVVARARDHFVKANEVMARCPRRVVRAPRIMGLAYRQVLEDTVARGWALPRNRVSLSKSHLIGIALRHAFI